LTSLEGNVKGIGQKINLKKPFLVQFSPKLHLLMRLIKKKFPKKNPIDVKIAQ